MPIYEYQCSGCGYQFEEWQGINDKPVRKCPQCSARKVQRLLSATSFQLKGGGWYADGYSSAKTGSSNSSSSNSDSSNSRNGAGNGTAAGETTSAKSSKSKGKKADSASATA